MKLTWSIKSIKHQPDGSWDALLVSRQGGSTFHDRVISYDGFQWVTRYHGPAVQEDVQNKLTECVGSMVEHDIRFVVF